MIAFLLVLILSKPGDPLVFGVVKSFPDSASCYQALQEFGEAMVDRKRDLGCLEVRRPRDV